jgi:AraC family transcriptional regulator
MNPDIVQIPSMKFIGLRKTMCLSEYTVGSLWKAFMPMRQAVTNPRSDLLWAFTCYPEHYFDHVDFDCEFEKWAAVEVFDHYQHPEEMEPLVLQAGLYAVFHYIGSSADKTIFEKIYGEWLPQSPYQLDHRPHVEVLGSKYKNNDPHSEEEIWIPIQLKSSPN